MAVLQFAFGSDSENLYLPHNLSPDSFFTLVLTTTIPLLDGMTLQTNRQIQFPEIFQYSGYDTGWEMMRQVYCTVLSCNPSSSGSLSLDTKHDQRPGFEQGNWQWRMTYNAFENFVRNRLLTSEIRR